MTNYREILRLSSLGLNKAQIAGVCGCSRTTVIKVLNIASAKGLSYPLPDRMSDKQLADALFPANAAKPEYKMPDYEYIVHEMQKSGITLNLLWLEYCEQCRNNGELPYQLTQFKKYYRDFTANYTESQFASLSGRLLNDKLVNISSETEAEAKVNEYANLKASYEKDFKEILPELNTNRSLLASLTAISQPTENISEQINELTTSIESLQKKKQKMILELENIGYSVTETDTAITVKELTSADEGYEDTYLYKLRNHTPEWIASCVTFKTDLCVLYASLDTDTDSASRIYRTAYQTGNYNTIIVSEANMGTLTGHISNMLVAGVGIVGGYVVSSFIFAEIYINKDAKKKEETAE
jgi:hypothetical protein